MGVRHLNRYLIAQCPRGIHSMRFSSLQNRTIAIDASIYLYKFKASNALIERTKSMISSFAAYNISPIFVFDGKPLSIKRDEINRRKRAGPRIHVTRSDVSEVKSILDNACVRYIDAPSEADEICARLVMNRQAYACMSNDMDMLVYGCDRVLRDVNFERGLATMYTLETILRYLDMPLSDFRQLCIASGTDYYRPEGKTLYTFTALYSEYRRTEQYGKFLEWLNSKHQVDDYAKASVAYETFKI